MQLGCTGVKLLGEGWSGMLIGIVPFEKSEKIVEFIMNEYSSHEKYKFNISDDLEFYVFKTYVSTGLALLDP